ncbi:LacI family DNA-binding transcriptional regulator [Jannaschia sp. M317]|uniref:LacI family DNA-binding transcriptional regulator n=1 Tax=Jannaschia sp. M317 TaxID=2867011 RepID=UPI0021A6917F|nr:LacI family DNA-binding transcriptional regulator [Jannaschia sp. M317]UWQ17240.1 LacI family transcriptional regulator [Jannaschia sp. M317]
MPERVTIKSIARDLGVSHMTVSRALSGHPNVLKETRDAVRKRAAELGYVKSAAAMAMRGDGTGIVGLLLPNIINEFYARFANTLATACDGAGMQLIIHLTNDDPATEEAALDRLREVQASSVVMVPVPGRDGRPTAQVAGLRTVQLIRQRAFDDATGAILLDDGPALRAAIAHLVGRGHSRIAYIGADAALSSGRSRLSAFEKGMATAGLPADLVRTGAPSFDMGRACAQDLLTGEATALLCGGFEISNGALSACLEDGGRIDFVGYGDPSFYAWVDGGVTTVQVPVEALAHHAVQMIVEGRTTETATFAAELVLRR